MANKYIFLNLDVQPDLIDIANVVKIVSDDSEELEFRDILDITVKQLMQFIRC
ncbi:hypothetical protein QCL51_17870 [Pseudomonas sp. LTR0]|uniref:hypothetical protein n=1 Tax=Pseudomonas sp. LTR0 TaxID=3040601 RepID=UPI0030CF4192